MDPTRPDEQRISGFDPLRPPQSRYGPSWYLELPARSRDRISEADTVQQATVQAVTEAVMLLHSLRRIAIWAVFIIPGIILGLYVIGVLAAALGT